MPCTKASGCGADERAASHDRLKSLRLSQASGRVVSDQRMNSRQRSSEIRGEPCTGRADIDIAADFRSRDLKEAAGAANAGGYGERTG
jgi:hypothetical protein